MRKWIYTASLVLGGAIGALLVHSMNHLSDGWSGAADSAKIANGKPVRVQEAVGVRIGRMISAASPAMNEGVPINKALDVLFAERKSPMRTRAFLKSRIQMMTTEQLTQAVMNGDVQSPAEIEELARRLAKEDPEGTFNHLEAGEIWIKGVENSYTFVDALLQTWADTDAVAVMERLKKMKRGGSQQDFSIRFSTYWAKADPAVAAGNFDDLIYLRNMEVRGNMIFNDNTYAGEIVESWKRKDEAGLREYIGALPAGRKWDALNNALKKLDESKR